MASPSNTKMAEYQHFVPQFLLRNFSKQYIPPQTRSGQQSRRGRGKAGWIHRGEPVVNHVDLTAEDTAVETVPVKRVMGMNNMYEDITRPTEKQRHQIEEIFGKLESQASPIFRRIVKGSEEGSIGLWLTRDERNTLRRFLFLLKYRGYRLHQRFCHNTLKNTIRMTR